MDSNICTCCNSLDQSNGKEWEPKSDTFGKKGHEYIQPQPPQSCKPVNVYKTPTVSFEDGTIYRLSYFRPDADTAAECRGRSLRRLSNFLPAGHMSSDTTHRHEYTWRPEPVPAEPDNRTLHDFLGGGRMPSLTTQKHDYTPKPVTTIVNVRPCDNIRLSDSSMEDTTITSASYQPIEEWTLTESCKPQRPYNAPSTPFAKDTVHTLSYIPPGEFVYVGNEEADSTDRRCSSSCKCCSQ
jgi:hypothetical protein